MEHTGNPWILWVWIKQIGSQGLVAWQRTPAEVWQRWLITITAGWGVASLVVLSAVWLLQLPGVAHFQQLDRQWLALILETRPVAPVVAVWMGMLGHPTFLAPLITTVIFVTLNRGHFFEAITMLMSFLMITLAVGLGWFSWSRARPDFFLEGALAPGLHSFPSGHVAQATTFYGLVAYYWVRRSSRRSEQISACLLLGSVALMVAFGRLWVAAHWPSDVVVSLVISAIWLTTLIFALRQVGPFVPTAPTLPHTPPVAHVTNPSQEPSPSSVPLPGRSRRQREVSDRW